MNDSSRNTLNVRGHSQREVDESFQKEPCESRSDNHDDSDRVTYQRINLLTKQIDAASEDPS